jgi:protein-disulfide isomerase
MANSSPKGLAIGLVALVVVAAVIFALAKHQKTDGASPEVASVSQKAPEEASAKPAADAKPETKSEPAAGTETKTETTTEAKNEQPAADATPGADLTSPSSQEEIAATTQTKESSSEEPKEEKKAAAGDNGSLLAGPAALDVDIDKAVADRSMGKDDAPVTMIEYASMTCPHCAHFSNDLLPEIKKELIDTGKLRLIYRDYPLDTFAMKAALMARCADPDKYFDLVEVIFKNQERWVKNADPVKGLIQLGALAGMNEDFIKACMANEELQSAILSRVQDAQKNYKLNATPTFIFNNGAETMSGDKEVKDFVNVVNKLTRK